MRIITKVQILTASLLLAACASTSDTYTVDVDGYAPPLSQQQADARCASHGDLRGQLKSTTRNPDGGNHDHYVCVRR